MSKIIGVTVGTNISPAKIGEKLKPVKTVNGKAPDENGNVEVGGGSVNESTLQAAINAALAQAKASGEFDGKDGKDGYIPIKGVDYFDGEPGKDGYTPVKGKDYFDGIDGKDGTNGKDGYTPVKGIDYFDGAPGKDGADGKEYVLTDVDKANIAASVIASLKSKILNITYEDGSTDTMEVYVK